MKEEQIRELFELTMRVANETNHHVHYELSAMGSGTMLILVHVNRVSGKIIKRFEVYLNYNLLSEQKRGYHAAKEYISGLLEDGRCPK
jgi:hypothetical protein